MADGLAMADVQRQWEREADERLQAHAAQGDRESVHAVLVTRAGDPVRQVTRYAAETGADLVVLGTHGRGAVAHMLMGSVAERVVRTAPCPVLTVRHPQHEFITDAMRAGGAGAGLPPSRESRPVAAREGELYASCGITARGAEGSGSQSVAVLT